MRKLLRSMARAAMINAGIDRINRGKRFADNWRKFYKQQIKIMAENIVEKKKISKIGRKARMLNRIESLKTDAEVARLIKRVGGLNGR